MSFQLRDEVIDLLSAWGAPALPATADLWSALIVAEQSDPPEDGNRTARRALQRWLTIGSPPIPAELAAQARAAVAQLEQSIDAGSERNAVHLSGAIEVALGEKLQRAVTALREALRGWGEALEGAAETELLNTLWNAEAAADPAAIAQAIQRVEAACADLQRHEQDLAGTLRAQLRDAGASIAPELKRRAEQALSSSIPAELQRAIEALRLADRAAARENRLNQLKTQVDALRAICDRAEMSPRMASEPLLRKLLSDGRAALAAAGTLSERDPPDAAPLAVQRWAELLTRATIVAPKAPATLDPCPMLVSFIDAMREELTCSTANASKVLLPLIDSAARTIADLDGPHADPARLLAQFEEIEARRQELVDTTRGRLEQQALRLDSLLSRPDEVPLSMLMELRLLRDEARAPLSLGTLASAEALVERLRQRVIEIEAEARHAKQVQDQQLADERDALQTEAKRWAPSMQGQRAVRLTRLMAWATTSSESLSAARREFDVLRRDTAVSIRQRAGLVLETASKIQAPTPKDKHGLTLLANADALRARLVEGDLVAAERMISTLEAELPKPSLWRSPRFVAVLCIALSVVTAGALWAARSWGGSNRTEVEQHVALAIDTPLTVAAPLVLVKDGRIFQQRSWPAGSPELALNLPSGHYTLFLGGRLSATFQMPAATGRVPVLGP